MRQDPYENKRLSEYERGVEARIIQRKLQDRAGGKAAARRRKQMEREAQKRGVKP